MAREKIPTTPAVQFLKAKNIPFRLHAYAYEERGGTSVAAEQLDVHEHRVIKTLVMEDENRSPLIVLMHGDREVSTKNLARALAVKSITPCDPKAAQRHTGYLVGGISPFGTRKALKVYMEGTIPPLQTVFINAGKRGLLAEIATDDLLRVLDPKPVHVAL